MNNLFKEKLSNLFKALGAKLEVNVDAETSSDSEENVKETKTNKRRLKAVTSCLVCAVLVASIIGFGHYDKWVKSPSNDEIPPEYFVHEDPATVAEQDVLDKINEARLDAGLAPLTWNNELAVLADVRVAELPECFGHTRPDGTLWSTVFSKIDVNVFTDVSECVFGSCDSSEPSYLYQGIMNEPSNCELILKEDYTSAGIAIYPAEDDTYIELIIG